MRPKSLILLTLALGCGLVASIGINQVLGKRPTAASAGNGNTTPIFVALAEINVNEPLAAAMLKLEEWPTEKVPPGALGDLKEVEGRRSRAKFYPGEPILEAKLLGAGDTGAGASDVIPKGQRVVSVKVDAVSSGGGLILPGDRVDVLVYVQENNGRGIAQTTTRTFLQNVKVFAVNDEYVRGKNGEQTVAARTISLLVTLQQAEEVMLASSLGEIRLAMRSASDDATEATKGVTIRDVLAGNAQSDSGPSDTPPPPAVNPLLSLLQQQAQAKPAGPAEPEESQVAWTMVVMSGAEAREVKFMKQGGLPQTTPLGPTQGAVPDVAPAGASGPTDDDAPESGAQPEPFSGGTDNRR